MTPPASDAFSKEAEGKKRLERVFSSWNEREARASSTTPGTTDEKEDLEWGAGEPTSNKGSSFTPGLFKFPITPFPNKEEDDHQVTVDNFHSSLNYENGALKTISVDHTDDPFVQSMVARSADFAMMNI